MPHYWGACEHVKMIIFVYLVILRLDLHSFLGAAENVAKMLICQICWPWVGPAQLDVVAVQAAGPHKADKHDFVLHVIVLRSVLTCSESSCLYA